MQITSPSKISMSSPRNGQSPKAKFNRVISAQLRQIKKSQCQSQVVLMDKNPKHSILQQNQTPYKKQFQSRQIQYVQLIRELHMENKKLKQKLQLEEVHHIKQEVKNQKKYVSPSKSPNLMMRLSPNSSFNKATYNPTHKRNFTVVNSASIPLCSPIQVRQQNQRSSQQIRRGLSPVTYKSPNRNHINNVLQSVNCSPKKSFQTIQALNSQIFYGNNIKPTQNISYSSPRGLENNSILIETQSFKKKDKNDAVQFAKTFQVQQKKQINNAKMAKTANPTITSNNSNFVNKLHFTYTKKDQKINNLEESKLHAKNQKIVNPLKLLQSQFDKLAQERKKQSHSEKDNVKNEYHSKQEKQQNQQSTTRKQSSKLVNQFDINKNIQQNPLLNSLQKKISKQFYVNDDNNEKEVQNKQESLKQKYQNHQYQVSSSYNKNIRFSRNNNHQSQVKNQHQQKNKKQMTSFQTENGKLSKNNIHEKKSIKSIIQLVRMDQSRHNAKQNQLCQTNQKQRQPQSINNLLQSEDEKHKTEQTLQKKETSKVQQKKDAFQEVQNSLEEKQKLSQCFQYKLFYATAPTPVQQKENQFITLSHKKSDVKTNTENSKSKHWRTPADSETVNKTDYHHGKFKQFGDSLDVSTSSLRSKKYSRISNRAYL